ncbi:MAG TPA: hypothetical protein PK626_05440 [Bacteroidales bacterium]|nr:hypothetical protein [Bacteroidales bacterium]
MQGQIMADLMLKFLTAESISEQLYIFCGLTGAGVRCTRFYVRRQGFEITDKAITIETLRNLPKNYFIEKFLEGYDKWLNKQIMNFDHLGYLPSEDALADYEVIL